MPFDSECNERQIAQDNAEIGKLWALAPTPSQEWATDNPDRFLALMFVAPQDCPALDALLHS
jgi:hypothetical protein